MHKLFLAVCSILIFASCKSGKISVDKDYVVVPDDRSKIISGKINRGILENDTAFAWFKENMKWGEAEPSAIAAFKKNASKFELVVVCGTWCHDSNNLLPKFYRLIDKAGYPESKVLLIAVDRTKHAYKHFEQKYSITNTPTFIVMQHGKEVGRVTEYGKTGDFEKELGEIISAL
jgi:thiol-disulfide isomerase/thioredoxin